VGGRIEPLWVAERSYSFPEELYWIIGCTYKGFPEEKCNIRNNFGSNVSFRKSVFEKLWFSSAFGRSDNTQLTSDDTEFSIRVWKSFPSSRVVYDPRAIVYHRIYPHRLSREYVIRRAFGDGLSKAFIARLHKRDALLSESTYLKNVFTKSLPALIKNMLSGKKVVTNIKRVMMLLMAVAAVAIGYFFGVLSSIRNDHCG
jgi:hypothetical protein